MTRVTRVVLVLLAAGCPASREHVPPTSTSGSLGMSRGGDLIYVAESDTNALVVLDSSRMEVLARVPVGRWPERVAVGPDERVYVSNRFSRSVSVVERRRWDAPGEEWRVGAEPIGLSVSPGGRWLAVANSASGTVSLVDLHSRDTREVAVGLGVTAVGFATEARLYATLYKGGRVAAIDVAAGTVDAWIDLALDPAFTGPAVGCPSCSLPDRMPNLASEIVFSADGERAYVLHAQVERRRISARGVADAPFAGSGWGVAPAVAAALARIDTAADRLLSNEDAFEAEPVELFTGTDAPVSGPSAAAVNPTDDYVYFANFLSNNVVAARTGGAALSAPNGQYYVVPVGAGPKGIAIAPDGNAAYVHNAFDHTISVIAATADGSGIAVARTVPLVDPAGVPVPENVQRGRKLFHAAADPRMSHPRSGLACASCHAGGRDDGRTWDLEGPGLRNTPSLAGRRLAETAPYHWDGGFAEFTAFQNTIHERMGGTGATDAELADILAYLDSPWNPPPDNPNRDPSRRRTEAQERGRALFEGKAGCGACHRGAGGTDNAIYEASRFSAWAGAGELINTPTLAGLFYSAPYLHDGSVHTLEQRVGDDRGGRHGHTADLTGEERADLVEFLKTL